jgi:hypothetical protein
VKPGVSTKAKGGGIMSWFEVATQAEPHLLRNDYEQCERIVSSALELYPKSPFHKVLELEFSNSVDDVAENFNEFFKQESARLNVAAIYTETNGFDINPNRWFFDLFAYKIDGGLDDPDWLSDWQSKSWPSMTLIGMEDLQAVYASEKLGEDYVYLASLLVVVKFQKLIFNARPKMQIGNIPVYSTGHDYDFIAKC